MNYLDIKNTEEKMLGDVYLEKNKKGEVVLCIAIGGGKVSKKVIKNNVVLYDENTWDTVKEKYDVKNNKNGGAK